MIKHFLFFIIGLISSLIAYEFFLWNSPYMSDSSPVVFDEKIGMWHKKNFSGNSIKECYRNKFFFDEFGRVKNNTKISSSRPNIVLIGDSQLEALSVKNENIIHNSLNKEYQNSLNFLNYGLAGSTPIQQYAILINKVDLDKTDYVAQFINVDYFLNSLTSSRSIFRRPKVDITFSSTDEFNIIYPEANFLNSKVIDFFSNFQTYSILKRTAYYLLSLLNKKDIINNTPDSEKINHEGNKKVLGIMKQTKFLLDKYNIKYKIIIFGHSNSALKYFKQVLKELNIDFEIIGTKSSVNLESFSCDKHWNDKTHKEIAKYLKKINFFKF